MERPIQGLYWRGQSSRTAVWNCQRQVKRPLYGEGEDVVGVHALLSGVVQVCHELLVGEEEEKEKEQGRQEEREVKGEGQSEENTRTWMTMWMVCKARLKLEPNVWMRSR